MHTRPQPRSFPISREGLRSIFRPMVPACIVSACLAGYFAQAARAQPIFVDFELIPGMNNSPGAGIPDASRLSDQYLATHGVRFSAGAPYIAVVIHGPGTPSGTRIIGSSTPGGALSYSPSFPIVAEFFDSTGTRPSIVSVVSVRGDLNAIPGTKTLQAFDASGVMIASQTLEDSNLAPLMVAAAGIHSVHMFSSSATIGFDDLRFDVPVPLCPGISGCGCSLADVAGAGTDNRQPDGTVDGTDFIAFINSFSVGDAAIDPLADVAGGGSVGLAPDGIIDGSDFIAFINAFAAGC